MLRLLGPVRMVGLPIAMTPQQLALVALLWLYGPLHREQIIERLWGGRAVSASRFANLLTEVRAAIGHERLIRTNDGRYELVDVRTDVDLLEAAVGDVFPPSSRWSNVAVVGDGPERLEQALELVDGPILQPPGRRFWAWLENSHGHRSEIEELVVAAGLRAAAILLADRHLARARWVCDRCLTVVPHDERLLSTRHDIDLVGDAQA